ncbi:MAG: hypothetical protein ACK5M0_08820 [Bacteroidales bacterium]
MRKIIFILLSLCFAVSGFAQNDTSSTEKLNRLKDIELYAGVNYSNYNNSLFGYGLGVNFVFFNQKPFNFVVNVIDFQNLMFRDNTLYNIGTFSFFSPSIRYNIGKKTKLFFELGVRYEFPVYDTYPEREYDFMYNRTTIENNFFFKAGAGFMFPVNEHKIFIKSYVSSAFYYSKLYLVSYNLVFGFAF